MARQMPVATARAYGALSAAIAVALVAWAGVARADCERACVEAAASCKQERCATLCGTDRRRCVEECRASAGCGGGIGTLAYVVSSCRVRRSPARWMTRRHP
jgi:hypothetical protein